MPDRLFARFKELQSYVNWSQSDAERIAKLSDIVDRNMDWLVNDFYAEIQRHPDASKVITGGEIQFSRLMASLRTWLQESLQGRSDVSYVVHRWNIGLRHAEIGLNPAFTAAAMSRLRNGIIRFVCSEANLSPDELCQTVQSINKMIDLDLSVIQDAYEAEYLRREKLVEHERSEVKFRMLIEAAVGLVIIIHDDDTIAYVGPRCEELTGFSEKELLGQRFTSFLINEPARPDVSRTIKQSLSGDAVKPFDGPVINRDGHLRWFVWNAQHLDDFDAAPTVMLVGQDVTERREAESKLLRSERLAGIGQMITGIAHESRNALQRIQSCIEMLEFEIENNQEAQRLVRRLQEAHDHLLRLFEEMRNYAAPIQLEIEACRLSTTWHDAWNSLEKARIGRIAELVEKNADSGLALIIDRFRMAQLFRNLLENSLAACSDPVKIEIHCSRIQTDDGAFVQIRFRDNGHGLTPAAKQNVFEPFFTTKTKGSGLGMAIARRIVEAHGGQIVLGNDLSVGAEFIITLPVTHQ